MKRYKVAEIGDFTLYIEEVISYPEYYDRDADEVEVEESQAWVYFPGSTVLFPVQHFGEESGLDMSDFLDEMAATADEVTHEEWNHRLHKLTFPPKG